MSKIFLGYEDGYLPFAPAAGAISGLSEEEITAKVMDVAKSPAAAVTYGSFTNRRNLGNEGITYNHNPKTGITVNSIGLANIGHVAAIALDKVLRPQVEALGKPLIPSFSPAKGEDPRIVLPHMAYAFAQAGVTMMEANYSCPNKESDGGEGYEPVLGYDLDTMFEIDQRIAEAVGSDITVIKRLPPYYLERAVMIPEVANRVAALGRQATGKGLIIINYSNTLGSQEEFDENGKPMLSVGKDKINLGGASGPAFAREAVDGLRQFRKLLPKSAGVISSMGANGAAEVYRRVDEEGADLAEGVTILTENEKLGKSYGQTITEMTRDYHEIHARIEELSQ